MKRYKGDELLINEWPCGCEIMTIDTSGAVIVRSPKDARAIIESLGRYIDSCSPAKSSNNCFNLTQRSSVSQVKQMFGGRTTR